MVTIRTALRARDSSCTLRLVIQVLGMWLVATIPCDEYRQGPPSRPSVGSKDNPASDWRNAEVDHGAEKERLESDDLVWWRHSPQGGPPSHPGPGGPGKPRGPRYHRGDEPA